MEFKDFVTILRRRFLLLLLIFGAVSISGVAYTFYKARVQYQSGAEIIILYDRLPLNPKEETFFRFRGFDGIAMPTRELILRSPELMPRAAAVYLAYEQVPKGRGFRWADLRVTSVELVSGDPTRPDDDVWVVRGAAEAPQPVPVPAARVQQQAAAMAGRIAGPRPVSTDPATQLFEIVGTADSVEMAADFANAYVVAAQVYSRELSIDALKAALSEYQRQREEKDQEIQLLRRRVNEEQVREWQRALEAIQQAIIDTDRARQELEVGVGKNAAEMEALAREIHEAKAVVVPADPLAPGILISQFHDAVVDALKKERVDLMIKEAQREQYWAEQNPLLQEMRGRRDTLEGQEHRRMIVMAHQRVGYLKYVNTDLRRQIAERLDQRRKHESLQAVYKKNVQDTAPDFTRLQEGLKAMAGLGEDIRRVQDEINLQRGFFRLQTQADREKGRAIQPALLQPMVMWALVALVVAVSLAYLAEYLDTRVHTDYDLRRHLNLPVLGIFERLGRGESPLLLDMTPRSPIAEAFYRVATILRSAMQEEDAKVLMIGSAVPREGKTTMSVNLAVAFARKGLRTLLIDGDLRIPQLHQIFGLDNTHGLGDLPREGAEPTDQLLAGRIRPSGTASLDILVGGPTSSEPMGLLESPVLTRVLTHARERYDMVIVDTPPVTSVGDALVLSGLCDGVLMIVGAEIADRRTVTWAKHLLGTVRARVYGATLNLARSVRSSQYYYYYDYAYGAKSMRTRE